MRLFEVGGHIRDHLLGIKSKDVDYCVVMNLKHEIEYTPEEAYKYMENTLESYGFKIFQSTPSCFTTRAQFPKGGVADLGVPAEYSGVADFVMARKEIRYIPGTRTPIIKVGTLEDDLERRDFTVNAIAKDLETGRLIDPYKGIRAIKDKVLICPVSTEASFSDDPLRILRALRFKITKGFEFGPGISQAIKTFDAEKYSVVSIERTREELLKMFKHNTKETILLFNILKLYNSDLFDVILPDNLWLEPTLKKIS